MTSRKTAAYGVGGVLLVAYLATANMPSQDRGAAANAPRGRPAPAGTDRWPSEVSAQAARLQARMAQAPVPDANPRNPFSFGHAPRAAAAGASTDAAPRSCAPSPTSRARSRRRCRC